MTSKERSYNKGNVCEICGKKTVNGYFRCKKHRIVTDETKERLKLVSLRTMEKQGLSQNKYKGNRNNYIYLHNWVEKKLGKPKQCEFCKKIFDKPKNIHWANIDHKYKKKLTDWLRLCAKCHRKYDIAMLNQS